MVKEAAVKFDRTVAQALRDDFFRVTLDNGNQVTAPHAGAGVLLVDV